MAKDNKCGDLSFNDSGSIFFWGLIIILSFLVVGNFILTMTIIPFFLGMESSIKLVPEMKAIKFYGTVDFERIYKKDGNVETFRDSPLVIDAEESYLKFDLLDRRGHSTNRFMMGYNGTNIKKVNDIVIKDSETKSVIFSPNKTNYKFEKSMKSLKTKSVHAADVSSPIDKKLEFHSFNLHLNGAEGSHVSGKEIYLAADQNVYLRSANGTIFLESNDIFIDMSRIPIARSAEPSEGISHLQYKLCICFPKGVLYRVQLSKMHGIPDPCQKFNPKFFDPCA